MGELLDILKALDWSPLFISLKTGIVATVVCFFPGVWVAIIMLIAFGIVVIMNLISGKKIKNQKRW